MPFKSKNQWRFMFAAERDGKVPAGTAREWARHTDKPFKKLPKKVKVKKAAAPYSPEYLAVHGIRPPSVVDLGIARALATLKAANAPPAPAPGAAPFLPPKLNPPKPLLGGLGPVAPNAASGIRPPAAKPLVPAKTASAVGDTAETAGQASLAAGAAGLGIGGYHALLRDTNAAPALKADQSLARSKGSLNSAYAEYGATRAKHQAAVKAYDEAVARQTALKATRTPLGHASAAYGPGGPSGLAAADTAARKALAARRAAEAALATSRNVVELGESGVGHAKQEVAKTQGARNRYLTPNGSLKSRMATLRSNLPGATAPLLAGGVGLAALGSYLNRGEKKAAEAAPPQPPAVPGQFKPSPVLSSATDPSVPIARWLQAAHGTLVPPAPPPSDSQSVASGQQLQNNIATQKRAADLSPDGLARAAAQLLLEKAAWEPQQFGMPPHAGFGAPPPHAGFMPAHMQHLAARNPAGMGRGQLGGPALYGYNPANFNRPQQAVPNNARRHSVDQDYSGAAPDYETQVLGLNRQKAFLEHQLKSDPQNYAAYNKRLKQVTTRLGGLTAMQEADERFQAERAEKVRRAAQAGADPNPFAAAPAAAPAPAAAAAPAAPAPEAAPVAPAKPAMPEGGMASLLAGAAGGAMSGLGRQPPPPRPHPAPRAVPGPEAGAAPEGGLAGALAGAAGAAGAAAPPAAPPPPPAAPMGDPMSADTWTAGYRRPGGGATPPVAAEAAPGEVKPAPHVTPNEGEKAEALPGGVAGAAAAKPGAASGTVDASVPKHEGGVTPEFAVPSPAVPGASPVASKGEAVPEAGKGWAADASGGPPTLRQPGYDSRVDTMDQTHSMLMQRLGRTDTGQNAAPAPRAAGTQTTVAAPAPNRAVAYAPPKAPAVPTGQDQAAATPKPAPPPAPVAPPKPPPAAGGGGGTIGGASKAPAPSSGAGPTAFAKK